MLIIQHKIPKGFVVDSESLKLLKITYKPPLFCTITVFFGFTLLWLGFVVLGHVIMLVLQSKLFFSSWLPAITLIFTASVFRSIGYSFIFEFWVPQK